MRKMFSLLILCIFLISLSKSQPQKINAVPSIGELVPEIIFQNLINSKKQTMRLSDLRGKLVILDFYGTWCGSCQPGIPKLDSLQKVLRQKLQVIVVCHDPDRRIVEKAISSRWKDLNIALPFVLTDANLNNLFPHKMVPHEVWIAPNGRLLATTDAESVNHKNIINATNGITSSMQMKTDQMNFDRNKPLFENRNGGDINSLQSRSVFSKFIDGISSGSGFSYDSVNGTKRYYFLNMKAIDMYKSVANLKYENRMILETKDTSRLLPDRNNSIKWYQTYSYCLDIICPLSVSRERLQQKCLDELNFNLNLKGRIEKRSIKCWVLIQKSRDGTSQYSKTNESVFTEKTSEAGLFKGQKVYSFVNKPVQFLNYILNGDRDTIIVDATNMDRYINLEIPVEHLTNIPALNKDLTHYGLQLIYATRNVDMLVISDNEK